jgi:hypothetical protein
MAFVFDELDHELLDHHKKFLGVGALPFGLDLRNIEASLAYQAQKAIIRELRALRAAVTARGGAAPDPLDDLTSSGAPPAAAPAAARSAPAAGRVPSRS